MNPPPEPSYGRVVFLLIFGLLMLAIGIADLCMMIDKGFNPLMVFGFICCFLAAISHLARASIEINRL